MLAGQGFSHAAAGAAKGAAAQPAGSPAGRKDPASQVAETSEEELRRRLGELEGQKAAEERKKTAGQARQSEETLRVISELQARDSQVRAHEAAHVAAGGQYITGGISFVYERGPDGRSYAVGGEVGIDTSPVPGKPEETAAKMRIVRAAALAPSDPSPADLSIAAEAAQIESEAMAEVAASRAEAAARSYGASPTQNTIDMVA